MVSLEYIWPTTLADPTEIPGRRPVAPSPREKRRPVLKFSPELVDKS